MPSPHLTRAGLHWGWRALCFFALTFAYLLCRVDPGLLYYWVSWLVPDFAYGWAFAESFAGYPGGGADYAAALLTQLYCLPWVAALLLAAVATALAGTSRAYLTASCGWSPWPAHFAPGVLLVALVCRFGHPLALGLAVLAAVLAAVFYARVRRRGWLSVVLFAFLGLAVHCFAAGAFLLFGVLCVLHEVLSRRRPLIASVLLAATAILPWASAEFLFGSWVWDGYRRMLPFHPDTDLRGGYLAVALYLALPTAALVLAITGRGCGGRQEAVTGGRIGWLCGTVLLLAIAVAAGETAMDSRLRRHMAFARADRLRLWDETIRLADGLGEGTPEALTCLAVNRALFHKGLLGDRMFAYPQLPAGSAVSPVEGYSRIDFQPFTLMALTDVLYDLGCVNEAEHMAKETYVLAGGRPFILRPLIMTGIAKYEVPAARALLGDLRRRPFGAARAQQMLDRLDQDPTLAGDEEIAGLRAKRIFEDYALPTPTDMLLAMALRRNPQNRMAFEYLMANLLADRRLEDAVGNLWRLEGLGYDRIPRHYEKAALLNRRNGGAEPSLGRFRLSADTLRRYADFAQTIERMGGPEAARQVLKATHGDTYFYYFVYGPGPEGGA